MSAPTRAPQDVVDELVRASNTLLASAHSPSTAAVAHARNELQSAVDDLEACLPVWDWAFRAAEERARTSLLVALTEEVAAARRPVRVSWWRRTFGADQ